MAQAEKARAIGFNHVALEVGDIVEALAFYGRLFDFGLRSRSAEDAFIEEANAAVVKLIPGSRPVPFGHLGDGNIHYNVSQPPGMERAVFLANWQALNAAVVALDNTVRLEGQTYQLLPTSRCPGLTRSAMEVQQWFDGSQ